MSKKLLALLLAALMLVSIFAGCTPKSEQPDSAKDADQKTDAPKTDTPKTDTSKAEEPKQETVNVRFSQFGNNLDDLDGYENDPIRRTIEEACNVTLEYDTGADGYDDRMQTELFAGGAPDLFPTWGEPQKIAQYVQEGLVTNIGEIINADPDRYPVLCRMINAPEYKAYNKLYTGDPEACYAIYSIASFAEPAFTGVPVYNQKILDEVNGGNVPATIDEFLACCKAAGEAGYVGWWPRNDKLTNWGEINGTVALPQGTSLLAPSGAGSGTILSGELGTDSEYWTISATSDATKAVVAQLAELYQNGGFDANIGIKGDFDDAYADFGAGKIAAACYGFGFPAQFSSFYNAAWVPVNPNAAPADLTVGPALTSDGAYGKTYSTGTWVGAHYFIPSACKYPDRVLDVVEYLASLEGQSLLHNCIKGEYNTSVGSDYWKSIDGAYGYGDGRCKYCWFSYLFCGSEYFLDLENQDWWTAVTHPVDFSDRWATETDAQLIETARDVIRPFVNECNILLPAYYNMVALPAEANDIVASLKSITNEYLAQFIGGQLSVADDWQKYVDAYANAGAAVLEEMINEAVATARETYGG